MERVIVVGVFAGGVVVGRVIVIVTIRRVAVFAVFAVLFDVTGVTVFDVSARARRARRLGRGAVDRQRRRAAQRALWEALFWQFTAAHVEVLNGQVGEGARATFARVWHTAVDTSGAQSGATAALSVVVLVVAFAFKQIVASVA